MKNNNNNNNHSKVEAILDKDNFKEDQIEDKDKGDQIEGIIIQIKIEIEINKIDHNN